MSSNEVLIKEAGAIVDLVQERNLSLRLLGSIAYYYRCPQYNYLLSAADRKYKDIDFVAKSKDRESIRKLFQDLEYKEDRQISVLYGGGRMVFTKGESGLWDIDVFYDTLEFCHDIPMTDRLLVDTVTVPLAELLLGKLQIIKLSRNDIIDVSMLFVEHAIADSDSSGINASVVAKLCAREWGLWRTLTLNLERVSAALGDLNIYTEQNISAINARMRALKEYVDNYPKPLPWRLRDKIGDRIVWYKEVDDL